MMIRASEIGVRPFRRKRERTSRVLAVRFASGGFDPAHPASDAPPRLNALILEARKLVPMTRWPVRRVYLIRIKTGQPGVGARKHSRRDHVVGKGPARDVLVEARSSGEQILRVHNLRHVPVRHIRASQSAAPPHRRLIVPAPGIRGATLLPRRHRIQTRLHRRLQLGAIRDRPNARRLFRQHPVGARRHALQHVPGVALGDAGRAAHEGVGAVADVAVEGRVGRVARIVLSRQHARIPPQMTVTARIVTHWQISIPRGERSRGREHSVPRAIVGSKRTAC